MDSMKTTTSSVLFPSFKPSLPEATLLHQKRQGVFLWGVIQKTWESDVLGRADSEGSLWNKGD